MKNAERLVIYSGLGLAVALGLGWRGVGSPAQATSVVSADPKPVRIATIDLGKTVVDLFLQSDAYKAPRDAEGAKMTPLRDMLEGMKGRLQKMDQKSPEFQAEVPNFQAKAKDLQDMENAFNAFQANQVAQCTREVAAAAKKVADRLGFTHVLISRPMEAEFRGPNPDAALSESLQRTVVVGEAGTDITSEVRKELKLSDLSITPVPQGGPQAPAAAPARPVEPAADPKK
jgi:Skp family chaperone for outer membrane proteins